MSSTYFLQLFSFALLLNILTSNKAPLLQLLFRCGALRNYWERKGYRQVQTIFSPSGSARRGIAIAGINNLGRQFFTEGDMFTTSCKLGTSDEESCDHCHQQHASAVQFHVLRKTTEKSPDGNFPL